MRTSILLLGVAALTACGHQAAPGSSTGASSARSHEYTVATGTESGNNLAAQMDGVLRGRVNADGKTACFWLENPPKPGDKVSGPIAVMWPHGSRAVADPLRVLNPDNVVLGRVGEHITITGGFIDSGAIPIVGCPGFTTAFGG